MYFPEGRPLMLLSPPALGHEISDVLGARAWRSGKVTELPIVSLEMGEVLNDFGVCQSVVGPSSPQVEDLPKCHSKSPNVTFRCIFGLEITRYVKINSNIDN
jgi:hypothetical protein